MILPPARYFGWFILLALFSLTTAGLRPLDGRPAPALRITPAQVRAAEAAVKQAGCFVGRYDNADPASPVKVVKFPPAAGDSALKRLVPHLVKLPALETLDLGYTKVTNAGLVELSKLDGLQAVYLDGTATTDAGTKHLARCTSLRWVELRSTGVTDAGVEDLTALRNLISLGLSQTPVTLARVKGLEGFTSLSVLSLAKSGVTDDGVRAACAVTSLEELDLSETSITLESVADLPKLTRLRVLTLGNLPRVKNGALKSIAGLTAPEKLTITSSRTSELTGIGADFSGLEKLRDLVLVSGELTDAGVRGVLKAPALERVSFGQFGKSPSRKVTGEGVVEFARLGQLTDLFLVGTGMTDAGLAEVARAPKLKRLWADNTAVTDEGLGAVARLRELEELSLCQTGVTDAGMSPLARLDRLRTLRLDYTRVTDAGLKPLATVKGLTSLNLCDCPVTDAGVRAFCRQLPRCGVVYKCGPSSGGPREGVNQQPGLRAPTLRPQSSGKR